MKNLKDFGLFRTAERCGFGDATGQLVARCDSFRYPADHFGGLSRAARFPHRHGAEGAGAARKPEAFEKALKGVGIDPERDVDQLTFASYRMGKQGVKVVGMAQGSFSSKTVLKRMKLKKIEPTKYRKSDIYPMGNGMQMTFLDENTLLFGDNGAVKGALDARDGYTPTLDSQPARWRT